MAVAEVLGNRFHELDGALDITVVLDSDEDVCRIGYGEALSVVTLTLTSSNVATKSKFAQFPQQRHAASSLQHSLNQDLTAIAGSAQIVGKPSLNRARLDPLLINMKLTDGVDLFSLPKVKNQVGEGDFTWVYSLISILSNRRATRFVRLHDPLSKRFALVGLVNLEIKFLRHSHFSPCAIGHTLVLHDGRLHCGMKHPRARNNVDFLHRAPFEHDLRLDYAFGAVLQRAPWHLRGNLGRA